jgi:hypothetical protein
MRNKIFMIVSLLAAVFVFNSCLKDNVGIDWAPSVKGKMYAEIWNAGFQALGLQPTGDTVTYKFLVNIATDQPPTQDITVTLAVDEATMNKYDTLKKATYKLYPYIKIIDNPVIIKKGTRNAYVHVQVWHADLLDACGFFMAPIIIQTATGGVVPADPLNQGASLMALPIANPYAADYQVVGYRIRPGNPTEPVNQVETLSTVDCKTVIKSGFGNYSAYNVSIQVTSTVVVVGGVNCFKVIADVIDPSTGLSVGGMWPVWTGDPTQKPADLTINYYNPVTKVFVLNCYYVSAAGNRIMYEVLTRL